MSVNAPAPFRRRGRPAGAKTQVRWADPATRALVWEETQALIAAGMERPPIRAVLYRMLAYGWSKARYGALTEKLGEWRDAGLIPNGVFSDGSGGRSRPLTASEIADQIRIWQETEPATLPADGYLRALLVEHEALVDQIQVWCDRRVLVVSSAGQIRRENLWTAVQEWRAMAAELGAKGILVYALVDRDAGGISIFGAHARWFRDVAGLELVPFGISDDQLQHFGLALDELWQIDGLIALDVAWWRQQIRELLLA